MLKNKVIIVTGGSGLLGRSMMSDIIRKGGTAVNFDIDLRTDHENHRIRCDITQTKSIDEAFEEVLGHYGKIDGLVNNAYPRTGDWGNAFENIAKSSWDKNVADQLNSCFYICQQVSSIMKKQQQGSIVNISSIYGIVGPDFSVYEGTNMTMPAAYSAIKGGIANFTRYLASLMGEHGIRVNSVSPGGIFNEQPIIFVENYEKKVPLGRMGKPEDIAPAVSFLLSDEASYITGHDLVVDGGWTAI